ncbi:hypothetical protein [Dyella sp.]|uniref:hypothetical protein n=1 Tax=Dyella sp. TaxID=1869338 RepID=UPI002FDA5FE3
MHYASARKPALLALLCCASAGMAQQPPRGSLCRPPEKTYYSCNTTHHKIISLCGALPNALQYRFGSPGKVELQYPARAKDGTKLMRYTYYFRFRTNYTEVVFDHDNYNYTVFDYDEGDGSRSAGVRVTGSDAVEHEIKCKEPVEGDLVKPGKFLKCDPDNALNDSSVPDSCHR